MPDKRLVVGVCGFLILLAGTFTTPLRAAMPPASEDEQTVWKLERAYWVYVEKDDLSGYQALWHEKFLGWPYSSPAPVRKERITDWITSQTGKGMTFRTIELKPAGMDFTGDIAVACYWVTYQWLGRDGKGPTYSMRITHTWVREGAKWLIIGGMSAPEPAKASK
ncbi:MAG: nuclear transport factor 2 family protein [Deltaproteobacteria bacterium]